MRPERRAITCAEALIISALLRMKSHHTSNEAVAGRTELRLVMLLLLPSSLPVDDYNVRAPSPTRPRNRIDASYLKQPPPGWSKALSPSWQWAFFWLFKVVGSPFPRMMTDTSPPGSRVAALTVVKSSQPRCRSFAQQFIFGEKLSAKIRVHYCPSRTSGNGRGSANRLNQRNRNASQLNEAAADDELERGNAKSE